jgi:CHAT domain-containing protein
VAQAGKTAKLAPDAAPIGLRYVTSYVPSAALLGWRATAHDARIVAVGALDYGALSGTAPQALAPLVHTRREVELLRERAAPAVFTALTDRGGDVQAVRRATASRVRVLHLATHGDPRELEPGHSGVWLSADGTGVPTRLEAHDVIEEGIAADLVTLSACGSGLGRVEQGEGVLGLTRAFLAAGSGSVLVSLWPVADESTAELMQVFYEGVLVHGLPRDRALAQAKRRLRAHAATAAPFHWAPFVLVGDPKPLSR